MNTDFPLLPCTHSLVPNDMLKVHVFDYQVETNDGRIIPAIGYKTEGFMSTFGQKEMILILVVGGNDYDDDDDDDENWVPHSLLAFSTSIINRKKKKKKKQRNFSYEEPLLFFRQLFGITAQSTVEHGSCTKFVGNGGLFGSSAILYVDIPSTAPASAAAAAASAVGGRTSSRRNLLNDEDNNLAYYSSYDEDCLAMILLYSEEERSALTTFGHLRLLGLLGHKQGYYPYPYWSELQRPSLFEGCKKQIGSDNAAATLSSCSALGMFTGRIFLPPTSTFTHYPIQKKLVLKMKKKIRTLNGTDIWRDSDTNDGSFFDDTQELPRSENPTILLPGSIEENADGCYVRTIREREFHSNKQQVVKKKKKRKKTTIITGSPSRTPSLLSSRSLSSSYNELLDDDDRINNNALPTQHDYYHHYDNDMMISRDKNMACCFLALVGHSDKSISANHYRMMEDGFFVYLSDTTWNEFWNHLMRNHNNQDYKIQLTEGMVLVLKWIS